MNNQYASASVSPSTPTNLLVLTVPARSGYSLTGVKCWSNCDVEWDLYLNGTHITGGLTSAAAKGVIDYFPTPWGLQAFDVVLLVVNQYESTSQVVNATLFYEQL